MLSFRGWHSEWNGILQAQYSVLFSFLLAVLKIGFVHFIHDAVHILRGQLSAGKKLSKLECEMLGFYFTLFSVGCCSAFNEFKIRKFGVSDVIAITAAGKTAFYYVDKEALVKFNGFLAPKAEGSYLILNEGGYQIEGQTDTWKVIDEKNVQEQRFVQLVCEQTKKQKPDIVLHDSGVLVAQTIYGFDSSVMKKIEKFLREQKPELLHHQKFLENGTAERAKESGTEQNYNMIDGCVNNNPKKPRIIGNRISVLDRLHIKLEERKQKSQPQQQQQQERSRKN